MISNSNQNFKQTEIGTIPLDWEVKKINEVAKINELNVDKLFEHEEIDYIDISSIKERRVVKIKRLLASQAPTRAKRIVRDNDILISTVRPNLKHFAFISKSTDRLVASTGFAVITAKDVNPHYLYNYLTSEYYTKYLTAIADTHTSTYPAFTPDVIETSLMPFPDTFEQEKIGKVLFDLDAKITLNFRMNYTLEAIGRTLFKHWFIQREKRRGWEMGSLGDIVKIHAGHAFKSNDLLNKGSIGVVKIKNISNNIVDIKNTQYVSRGTVFDLDKRFLIKPGAILIAMTGANVGKIGIVPQTNKELWLNQRVGMFKEKINKGINFIYLLLSSNKYKRILKDRAFGTAQPNISCSDIESLELILPPKEIIAKFGILFEPFIKRIISNLYENEKLSEVRDTLLPKLISGRLRLN